jgi:hypothetical protein
MTELIEYLIRTSHSKFANKDKSQKTKPKIECRKENRMTKSENKL